MLNLDHPDYTEHTSLMSIDIMLCLYLSVAFEPVKSKSHYWIVVRGIKPGVKSVDFPKCHVLAFQKVISSKLLHFTKPQFLHL